jgi:hypothetical protein
MIAPLMLIFATIGLYLLYIANKYNLLFVYNADIDTKGLIYPRALQQLTTGIYIAEVCMIGLFGINQVGGPIVLMVIYTIFSILFHISLNNAINPLLETLPTCLTAEEENLLADPEQQLLEKDLTHGASSVANNGTNGTSAMPPLKAPNMFAKFFHPEIYSDYRVLRATLVPQDDPSFTPTFTPEMERHAYSNPAVSSRVPLLWIPRDEMGISRQECKHTGEVQGLAITDEGAGFEEGGKMVWDESRVPPVHEDTIRW